jgi:CBS domain-containing protein
MDQDIRTLRAGDIMTRLLITAAPEQKLERAEALLIEHRISGVPVVDNGRLVGVLSRSDIARVQVLAGSLDGQVTDHQTWSDQADGFAHQERGEFRGFRKLVAELKVKDAMRDQVITCTPQTPVNEVAKTMVRLHIHRVIVVENECPVGIISSLDLAKLLVASDDEKPKGS